MRDVSDVMLVAIFSLLSLQLLEGWVAIITGLVAIPYIIVRILALKKNNREKEQEKRDKEQEKRDKERHEMEVRLLQKKLDGEG